MSDEELLEEYSESIRRLRKQCRDAGMTDDEFRTMYFESLNSLENVANNERQEALRRSASRKYKSLLILAVLICITAFNFSTIYSSLVCNLQEYIYPGLKLLRRISVPFMSLFPSLSEWYHETCLIQNPFFSVADMDCWPCSAVTNVREVNDPKPGHQHSAPFIYETDQKAFSLENVRDVYIANQDVFDKESPKILINNKYHSSAKELFSKRHISEDKNYYVWRFDSMNVARLLRQWIPRPRVVPKFGQSTERYLIVHTSHQPYKVPDTECSFAFLLALSGSRTIEMRPAVECEHQCKSLHVHLKQSYLLWYNWWYWRPVVRPSHGNSSFVAHVGSYC